MDAEVVRWFAAHRAGWADPLFIALTIAGFAGWIWIVLAAAGLRARTGIRGAARLLVPVLAGVWGSDLAAQALKAAVGRERPFEALPDVEPVFGGTVGASLPSGHAATSAAGAVLVAAILPRLAWALAAIAVAICVSRLYLGAHYATDVLAGAALGLAIGSLASLALRRSLRATGSDRTATGSDPRSSGSAAPP